MWITLLPGGAGRIGVASHIANVSSYSLMRTFRQLHSPETNSQKHLENRRNPKRKIIFQPWIFRDEAVSFREGT